MLKVKRVRLNDKFLTLVFIEDKIFVTFVQVGEILQWNGLFVVSSALLDVSNQVRNR